MSSEDIGIVFPKTEEYLYGLLRPRDAILRSLEADAEKNSVPIIGPLVGNLLAFVIKVSGARTALEIGTATGYSGLWMAMELALNSGHLTTIEMDEGRIKKAEETFSKVGVASVVNILKGDAKKILPRLARDRKGEFDLIFLDVGEKSFYVDALEHCIELLGEGGLLLADNVLWGGYVGDPSDRSSQTQTMRKFNKMVFTDRRLDPLIVPLRDGVLIARKSSA